MSKLPYVLAGGPLLVPLSEARDEGEQDPDKDVGAVLLVPVERLEDLLDRVLQGSMLSGVSTRHSTQPQHTDAAHRPQRQYTATAHSHSTQHIATAHSTQHTVHSDSTQPQHTAHMPHHAHLQEVHDPGITTPQHRPQHRRRVRVHVDVPNDVTGMVVV